MLRRRSATRKDDPPSSTRAPGSAAPGGTALSHPVSWQLDDANALWYSECVETNDWRQVRDLLVELDPVTRTSILARQDSGAAPVDLACHWVSGAPYDPLAPSFHGWSLLSNADRLDDTDVLGVPAAGDRAEEAFRQALELDPNELSALVGLVASGAARGVAAEEITARYEAAHAGARFIPVAVEAACRGLFNSQHGGARLMLAFAQLVANEAPSGSPAISCLASAYLAEARRLGSFGRLGHPQTRIALRGAARRSILQPDFPNDLEGRFAVNAFAAAFWFGQHRAEAREVLPLAHGWFHPDPWRWDTEPNEYLRWVEFELGRLKPWEHPF